MIEYEDSKQSYLKAVRNTVTQSIAKKFGAMFSGVAEESDENFEEELGIPDEFEEIYAKVHEDLIENCADAHISMVKQCSARLLFKALKSLSSHSKKLGLEHLKINTIERIIEGKGPLNTYEGQGKSLQVLSIPENNTKSIRTTLGPSLRDAIVGRRTISDKTLVSRFYSKNGENLSNIIGSSSFTQTFLTYMKEQKDSLIVEKQLRVKSILKTKYLKFLSLAMRKLVKVPKKDEILSKHVPHIIDLEKRGRQSVNSESKFSLYSGIEEEKKFELLSSEDIPKKDIGKFLNSQGSRRSSVTKDSKSLAVKIAPRPINSVDSKKRGNFSIQNFESLYFKPVKDFTNEFDVEDTDDRINSTIYPSIVAKDSIEKKDSLPCSNKLEPTILDTKLLKNDLSLVQPLVVAGLKAPPPPPPPNYNLQIPPPPNSNFKATPPPPNNNLRAPPPPPPSSSLQIPPNNNLQI